MALPSGGGAATSIACSTCSGVRLWTWDGSSWHSANLTSAPPPFALGGAVDDPSSGGVLVTAASRTWTLSGTSVHSADLPPAMWRSQAAMAGDPAHHDVVLFGGFVAKGIGDDTWTWDGRTWTHRAGQAPPVPSPGVPQAVPAPLQVGTPRSAILAPTCGFAGAAFGGTHPGGGASFTYAFPLPPSCTGRSVTVTLVDSTDSPLDVKGNGRTFTLGTELQFTWSNWCGSGPVLLKLSQKTSNSLQSIVPPGCKDRSAPSIVSFQVSSAIP
jgi:hypothetical protein